MESIILYGLNNATYKIALGKSLLDLTKEQQNVIPWETLAKYFLDNYLTRLSKKIILPQQANPARLTVMERIVREFKTEIISYDQAIYEVSKNAFNDVIPRFQTIGTDKEIVKEKFYEFKFGKQLIMKDAVFHIAQDDAVSLYEELEARWSLLEGAFSINQTYSSLANDIRDIYLKNGYNRTDLTSNITFLSGYQGNTCFYCGEPIQPGDIHVDHLLPRQVINQDEIWNLVLSHSYCNQSKSDQLVAEYYIEKLIARNENIMGSNHPWKQKKERNLGRTPQSRASRLKQHYNNVRAVLGAYHWGGIDGYIAEKDVFTEN